MITEDLIVHNIRTQQNFQVETAKYSRSNKQWLLIVAGEVGYKFAVNDTLMFIDTAFSVLSYVGNNGEIIITMERKQ